MPKSDMTSEEFASLSVGERLENLLRWSLEDCRVILDYDVNDDRHSYGSRNMMVNAKLAVIRVVLEAATKAAGRDGRLKEQRDQVFGEMAAEYRKLKPIDGGKKS
jgi:hypothetical protein